MRLPISFLVLSLLIVLNTTGIGKADEGHHHSVPTLKKGLTEVAYDEDKITITFGPIDLPVGHSGDLAASMPKHFFKVPEDRYLTGFKSEVFTKDGKLNYPRNISTTFSYWIWIKKASPAPENHCSSLVPEWK